MEKDHGNFRILHCGTVPSNAIFCGGIPLHRPCIGLIYGRYLQIWIQECPLKHNVQEENHRHELPITIGQTLVLFTRITIVYVGNDQYNPGPLKLRLL